MPILYKSSATSLWTSIQREICHDVKEKLCYISLDFDIRMKEVCLHRLACGGNPQARQCHMGRPLAAADKAVADKAMTRLQLKRLQLKMLQLRRLQPNRQQLKRLQRTRLQK